MFFEIEIKLIRMASLWLNLSVSQYPTDWLTDLLIDWPTFWITKFTLIVMSLLSMLRIYIGLSDCFFKVTGNTPLMYAAMENKINTLERMIELG